MSQLGSVRVPYFLSAGSVAALLARDSIHDVYDLMDAGVRGYTSRDLRDVGGSSLLLSLPSSSRIAPGAYTVLVRAHDAEAAVGIASVSTSGGGKMEVIVMGRLVSGGQQMAALTEDVLARRHPLTSVVSVRVLERLRPFDPLANGPWLRDSLCRLCDAVDESAKAPATRRIGGRVRGVTLNDAVPVGKARAMI